MKKKSISYNLPKGWIMVSLQEIITLEYGKNLIGKDRREGSYAVYGSNGIVGYHCEYLVEGPIIIIGRKGAVGTVHFSTDNCWPIDTTYFLKPLKSISFKFIYYLLHNLNLKNLDKSTTIPGLNRDNVYALKVALPPLNEQYRIVSKIEELMSELEDAAKTLQKAKRQLEIYKQAFFKKAFNGGITKKWRKTEAINRNNKTLRQFSNLQLETLSLLPPKWKWIPIDNISEHVSSGSTPKGGSNVYVKEGIPFIRSQNVYPGVLRTHDIVFISNEINEKMKRTQLKDKDVLLNITGASIGRCAYVPENFGQGNVNQHVCIIRINQDDVFYKYLCHYLNSPEAQIHINRINSGATREALTLEQINNFPIPLCSLEEQGLIVQELEYRFTIISNLEDTINTNLKEIELSRSSILKKAFKGNLIPQNTDDEPASQSFERVVQERIEQVQLSKITIKKKLIMNEKLSITEVLSIAGKAVATSIVWQQSAYKTDIDGFYSALKGHIENNEVQELPRKGKESFLTITTAK